MQERLEWLRGTLYPMAIRYKAIDVQSSGAGDRMAEVVPEIVGLERTIAEYVEMLAEHEHEQWMAERISRGWTLGERDVKNKRTPYLVPYDELTEEIKDYDRDAVRNIPALCDRIGMAIYERK